MKPGEATTRPAGSELGTEPAPETQAPPQPSHKPLNSHKSILLVDDDPFILKLLTLAMREMAGWHVAAFESPADALDAFAANPSGFDVVVTDYVMPVMNGAELGRRVRMIAPHVKTILISGHAVAFAAGRSADFDASLAKPFMPSQLTKLIRRLDEEQAEREHDEHLLAVA